MIKRLIWNLRLDKNSICEWVAKNFPFHIPLKKPICTNELCMWCGLPMNKLCAIDTGDGWLFEWECESFCGDSPDDRNIIENWYPFLFGAWSSDKDLMRIGIEVL